MSDFRERLVVHCPDSEASLRLAAFVAEHIKPDGTISVKLGLPINVFADHRPLLERHVFATLYALGSVHDSHPTYSVSWSTKAGGPFPYFAGALAVETATGDDCFGLLLTGHCEPPSGIVQSLFDIALGRRIAQVSARNLLHTIADYVEYASAHDAAARAGNMRSRHLRVHEIAATHA